MRIIGGRAKGTNLLAPAGRNTRPTLGRVRESIFNVLANVGVMDTAVLDIFAGTGAMGLEALSRGAASAVFIDKTTGRIIRENAKKCHVEDQVSILSRDVNLSLKSLQGKQFDYIFMTAVSPRTMQSSWQNILFLNLQIYLFWKESATFGKRKKWGLLWLPICFAEEQREKFNENSDLPWKF